MDECGLFTAELISSAAKGYANGVVTRQLAAQPDLVERRGASAPAELAGDTQQRLLYLAEAVACGHPRLFVDHTRWLKVACTAREVPLDELEINLRCIREELAEALPPESAPAAVACADAAIEAFPGAPDSVPSLLLGDAPHLDLARRYLLAVLETRRAAALALLRDALDAGVEVTTVYDALTTAQAELGRMWQMNEVTVAEEHYSSAVTGEFLAYLRQRFARPDADGPRVLCTTVGGDFHDLGIRTVANYFEMAGWQSICLGASMPAVDLLHAIVDFEADMVAVSASTTLQVRPVANLIAVLRGHVAGRDVPILVGGQPFDQVPGLWREVGADGCATTAERAVVAGERLLAS